MRALGVIALLALALWGAGCGGGQRQPAQPLTAQPHTLQITSVNRQYGLPQMPIQTSVTATTRLWMPQNAAIMEGVTLAAPWHNALPLSGPTLISPTDGTNQTGMPYAVLWGEGKAIPKQQPLIVQPHQALPGYVPPTAPLYGYSTAYNLDAPRDMGGAYALTAQGGYAYQWTLGAQPMLATATITEPEQYIYTMRSHEPFVFSWKAVSGAVGYFVNFEATVKNKDDVEIGTIVWSSAREPLIFSGVYDFSPHLLRGNTRSVTVPANIFNGCESVRVDLLAQGPMVKQRNGDLTLTLVNASLTSQLYVVVDE